MDETSGNPAMDSTSAGHLDPDTKIVVPQIMLVQDTSSTGSIRLSYLFLSFPELDFPTQGLA